jgi:hypothetical protein
MTNRPKCQWCGEYLHGGDYKNRCCEIAEKDWIIRKLSSRLTMWRGCPKCEMHPDRDIEPGDPDYIEDDVFGCKGCDPWDRDAKKAITVCWAKWAKR